MSATDLPADEIVASCSFCGKPSSQVQKLVAGPGVFICDECVDLSAAVIAETAGSTPEESARRRHEFVNRCAEDILATLPALGRAAARVEAELARWVGRLREQGTDWQQIADALELPVPAVRRRFETGA